MQVDVWKQVSPHAWQNAADTVSATVYSRMPCFSSQTRNAARSKLLVRVRVPTAGRFGSSAAVFVAAFGLRFGFFCVFRFGSLRTVASLTFSSPPVIIGPINVAALN